MKRIYILLNISLILLFLSAGCSNEEEIGTPAARRTVLVYLAGNNNLSNEVWEKIDCLTFGWHNTQDNLLIYQHTQDAKGTPSLLRVVGDATHPYAEVIRTYPKSNAPLADQFSEVLQDAMCDYPAPSYGLLLFSHGTGWLPEGNYVRPRSATEQLATPQLRSLTNDNGREMEITDFAAVLPDHLLDFIVLEACLMSSVEVAYELRDKADYLLASSSEILSPGFTALYSTEIYRLFAQPTADLAGFANCYYQHCNQKDGLYRSATISLIRLDQMKTLATALRPLYAVSPSLTIDDIQSFDRTDQKLFFDLASFAQKAGGSSGALTNTLSATVPYKAATDRFVNLPIAYHSGLTVYIEQPAYPQLNAAWQQTAWYRATH